MPRTVRASVGGYCYHVLNRGNRFKAFPIEEDEQLLTVLRHIERNALRANLVARAEDWQWSSLTLRLKPTVPPWAGCEPGAYVNAPQTEAELKRLRLSVRRDAPYGNDDWVERTVVALGLESSLRRVAGPDGNRRRKSPRRGRCLRKRNLHVLLCRKDEHAKKNHDVVAQD
jgi:putative transposase